MTAYEMTWKGMCENRFGKAEEAELEQLLGGLVKLV